MESVLGISAFYHDSAAALIIDGKIVAAAQEERFTRIKHDKSYPSNAINFVLEFSSLKIGEIDSIVFFEKPFLKFERLIETYLAFSPRGFKSFIYSMPIWLKEKLFQKKFLIEEIKKHGHIKNLKNKLYFSEHHLSHAASAFYPSPFKEALIVTADGVGEWATTTISIGKENKINIVKELNFPHSLGLLYSAFTYYIGFKVNSGEYKLMGLAPYGKPKYKDIILKKLIDVKEDGSFLLNQDYFNYATGLTMTNNKFEKLFGQKVRDPRKDDITEFHMDIAASIQEVTEEIILKICRFARDEFKIDNLCLAGGVALNCVANGKILKNNIFKNVWIQPAAGDAGCALGAALAYWHINKKNARHLETDDNMKGSLLGPQYSNSFVKKYLDKVGANYQELEENEVIEKTSEEISNGKAIGWFQGRSEFGPRALGNRSILADPRNAKMQKLLNLKIKFRESFRPFAPAVIEEDVSKWFDLEVKSPYMLLVAEIKEEIKNLNNIKERDKLNGFEKIKLGLSKIPAVTHVDCSARVQTVNEKKNRKFYKLINKFKKKTGCPILINTSFNVRGEPIVNTPEEAFNCFMGNNLDVLVIENFFLKKEMQNKSLKKNYKSHFELD
tara:strand:- start:154 stop:1995 length:1842 start_codon:yes stop_codon:yes gene_type:complete